MVRKTIVSMPISKLTQADPLKILHIIAFLSQQPSNNGKAFFFFFHVILKTSAPGTLGNVFVQDIPIKKGARTMSDRVGRVFSDLLLI